MAIQLAIEPRPINAPVGPLVTPANPAVTPDAVKALTDSFREGFITSQDIIDRLGQTGQLKRQAETQQAREFVDPAAVAARQAAVQAGGSQAGLVSAQAKAGIPYANDMARLAFEKQQEDALYGDAVKTFKQYRPPILNADGSQNLPAMAEAGTYYLNANRLLQRSKDLMERSQHGLAGNWVVTKDKDTNAEIRRFINARGEDITSIPGQENPNVTKYRDLEDQAHELEGDAYEMISYPTDVNKIINEHKKAQSESLVAPKTGASKPSVMPEAGKAQVYQGQGIEGPIPGMTAVEILDRTRGLETYKTWAEKADSIERFKAVVAAYGSDPEGVQPIMSSEGVSVGKDVELANAVLQMSTPGSTPGGRGQPEFRVTSIAEAQPLIERILNIKAEVLGQERFGPQTRARLIEAGQRAAESKERGAREAIQLAASQLPPGTNPKKVFLGSELEFLSGGSTPASIKTGSQMAAPVAGSTIKRVVNGTTIYERVNADGTRTRTQ